MIIYYTQIYGKLLKFKNKKFYNLWYLKAYDILYLKIKWF